MDNQIFQLQQELARQGVRPEGSSCQYEGQKRSISSVVKIHKQRANGNKQLILSLWQEFEKMSKEPCAGSHCEHTAKMFVPAIKELYNIAREFDELNRQGISNSIYNILCSDVRNYSGSAMAKAIDFKMAIEWVNHLIYRDLYVCCMLRKYSEELSRGSADKVARGVDGPWGRLDLPMLERVFEWDNIDEEIRGRDKDIRKQKRYEMGLEGYNTPGVKEGFYWRELRNEPYSFSDPSSNPYPHRNLLWNS